MSALYLYAPTIHANKSVMSSVPTYTTNYPHRSSVLKRVPLLLMLTPSLDTHSYVFLQGRPETRMTRLVYSRLTILINGSALRLKHKTVQYIHNNRAYS